MIEHTASNIFSQLTLFCMQCDDITQCTLKYISSIKAKQQIIPDRASAECPNDLTFRGQWERLFVRPSNEIRTLHPDHH